MPIPATGAITLAQIQTEFGGADPISINEYYRGGAYVPNTTRNNGVPTSGGISFENFRSSSKTVVVSYDIIGGGGTGGFGVGDGGSTGRAPNGGTSFISATATIVAAGGGTGGSNGAFSRLDQANRIGKASAFGTGGAAGNNRSSGGNAPSTSYGAGGGGGGGDAGGTYDASGNGGEGGFAGTRLTGSFTVAYGTVLTITIGAAGGGSGGQFPGGSGANGFCSIVFDGITRNFTTTQNTTII